VTNTEREAQRRVNEACRLIASAYRLEYLVPSETVNAVRSAIVAGMEQATEDAREEANAA
jgi:hypothetical protein